MSAVETVTTVAIAMIGLYATHSLRRQQRRMWPERAERRPRSDAIGRRAQPHV
jgi:hypothetical protein